MRHAIARACLCTRQKHLAFATSLALVGDPSSDGVMIKISYGVDVLHRPASSPIFSYWIG